MQNKKWLSILLAAAISVGLWLYVVTIENPVEDRKISNIPVVFVGEEVLRDDYDLMITQSNVPAGISLTFVGKLADLNKLTENKSELALNIDVSNLRSANEYPLSFDIYDLKLPTAVSVQNLSLSLSEPKQVSIVLEDLAERTIPVKVSIEEVDVMEGYVPDRLVQNYSEIVVQGPVDSLDRVSYALAVLKRENVDQTITSTLSYQLIDENGESINDPNITSKVTEIEVTLPVLMYKDVPLDIAVIDGGGATGADTVIDIEPSTVRLSGDPKVLEGIQSIKLPSVDLASLMSNKEDVVRVITIPDDCTNLSGEQEATVSIQIKNKAIRQMRVSSNHFSFTGVPTTLQATARTNVLPITIRANEGDIDLIAEDNIRVVIDFSEVTLTQNATSMTMPAKIYVDGFVGAGAIGAEYSVVVDLAPVTE